MTNPSSNNKTSAPVKAGADKISNPITLTLETLKPETLKLKTVKPETVKLETVKPETSTRANNPKSVQAPFDASISSEFFTWSLGFLEKRGREIYGNKFVIAPSDYDIVHKLLIYFLSLHKEARKLSLDLTKGIFLTGPVGCGKTALMTLMKYVALPGRHFLMKPCRDISFEFFSDGYEALHRYSTLAYDKEGPKAYCFDDLGSESALHHYGNDCCVMAEILLTRYDRFITTNMITHITTNYAADELEKIYGNRVRSRMREMFNLISFKNGTADKR